MSDIESTPLPCPFCGGEAELIRLGSRRCSCQIACTQCGGRHESSDEGARSGESWNERATDPQVEALRALLAY